MSDPGPLWIPTPEKIREANLTAFIDQIRGQAPGVDDYTSLYQWSVDHNDTFWSEFWKFSGINNSSTFKIKFAKQTSLTLNPIFHIKE